MRFAALSRILRDIYPDQSIKDRINLNKHFPPISSLIYLHKLRFATVTLPNLFLSIAKVALHVITPLSHLAPLGLRKMVQPKWFEKCS